jgi:hypothetical protein
MGVGDQRHSPAALTPRNKHGIHFTGGWVGCGAGLDGSEKSRPPLGFDPRTVLPVETRCTDWAVPAHVSLTVRMKKCMKEVTDSEFYNITFGSQLISSPYSLVHPRPVWPYCFLANLFCFILGVAVLPRGKNGKYKNRAYSSLKSR